MCGIAGRIGYDGIVPEDVSRVRKMMLAMRHRGPNSYGECHGLHAFMAGCRLSIVDVEGGSQPLHNETGRITLVANGEIYNHLELRALLTGRGHTFATGSDCECIVHLYEEYGEECVDHLRGMFAFALLDEAKQRVIVARDRMGEKPLYLCEDDGGLYFSSELRPCVASGAIRPELNAESVVEYFHFGYVPEPHAVLRGVRKLPAGAMLVFDGSSRSLEQHTYWRLGDAPLLDAPPAKVIREQLDEIGELIIRADVPIGVSLSSGMDSSIIAALAAGHSRAPVHAFTLGYEGRPRTDERAEAQQLAQRLGMVIHDIELTLGEVADRFVDVVGRCDDPISDGAAVAYDAISRAAGAAGVPVLLAGHGGDELFLRYGWCRKAVKATIARRRAIGGDSPSVLEYGSPSLPPFSYVGGVAWLKDLAGIRSAWECWAHDRNRVGPTTVCYEFTNPFRQMWRRRGRFFGPALSDVDVERAACRLHAEIGSELPADCAVMMGAVNGYLRENGIAQGDRLSMANSVELRLPFVDYRLAETVAGLRLASAAPTTGDGWLRAAVANLLPPEVMARPKRGFSAPWRRWHRALFHRYGGCLVDGLLTESGILKRGTARSLAGGVSRLGLPVPMAWEVLCLELWWRQILAAAGESSSGDARNSDGGRRVAHAESGIR